MNTDKLIARARELAELRARASEGWELNSTGHPHMDRVQILRAKGGGYIEVKSANVIERQYNLRLAFAAPEMAELLEQMADRLEKLESWARPMLEQFANQRKRSCTCDRKTLRKTRPRGTDETPHATPCRDDLRGPARKGRHRPGARLARRADRAAGRPAAPGRRVGSRNKRPMIRWTPEMIEFVRQAVKDMTIGETAEQLSLAYGITITHDQIKSVLQRYSIKTGRTGRFEPGHIAWNAGMKGWKAGGRADETRFKPGYLNGQAAERLKPLGHERITKDGIRQRKVCMDGPAHRRWRSVHSLVWEERNGPIPPGHVVIFIDGDRENIHIDNLALVSRGELSMLNKRGWHDLPAELRPAAIAAVRLEKQAKAREEAA